MVQIIRENLELDTQLAHQDGDVFSSYGIIQSLVCEQLLGTSSLSTSVVLSNSQQ